MIFSLMVLVHSRRDGGRGQEGGRSIQPVRNRSHKKDHLILCETVLGVPLPPT